MDTQTRQPEPLLVDLRTASVLLGMSVGSMRRLIAAGEVDTVRIGGKIRLRREAIDELVNWCTIPGAAP